MKTDMTEGTCLKPQIPTPEPKTRKSQTINTTVDKLGFHGVPRPLLSSWSPQPPARGRLYLALTLNPETGCWALGELLGDFRV